MHKIQNIANSPSPSNMDGSAPNDMRSTTIDRWPCLHNALAYNGTLHQYHFCNVLTPLSNLTTDSISPRPDCSSEDRTEYALMSCSKCQTENL